MKPDDQWEFKYGLQAGDFPVVTSKFYCCARHHVLQCSGEDEMEKIKMLQPSVAVAWVAHHSALAHCDQVQSLFSHLAC